MLSLQPLLAAVDELSQEPRARYRQKGIILEDPCKSKIIQFFLSFEWKLGEFFGTYSHICRKIRLIYAKNKEKLDGFFSTFLICRGLVASENNSWDTSLRNSIHLRSEIYGGQERISKLSMTMSFGKF